MAEIQEVTLDIHEIPRDIASQKEIASPASEVEAEYQAWSEKGDQARPETEDEARPKTEDQAQYV